MLSLTAVMIAITVGMASNPRTMPSVILNAFHMAYSFVIQTHSTQGCGPECCTVAHLLAVVKVGMRGTILCAFLCAFILLLFLLLLLSIFLLLLGAFIIILCISVVLVDCFDVAILAVLHVLHVPVATVASGRLLWTATIALCE